MAPDLGRGESPQVQTVRVAIGIAGIIVMLSLIAFGFQLLFRDRIQQTYVVRHSFPAPAVVSDERAERMALQAKQKRDLDGANGRVPIAAAVKAIAARGDRAFDPVRTGS